MPALIAEGGFQEFTLKGGEWAVLLLSAAAALIAIAVGLIDAFRFSYFKKKSKSL